MTELLQAYSTRPEQLRLAYERSLERIDKMTTAEAYAAYRAGDQPFRM